jgi:hypothetical protein
MFFTLGAGILVAAGFFLSFLRSRHNREIAAYTPTGARAVSSHPAPHPSCSAWVRWP